VGKKTCPPYQANDQMGWSVEDSKGTETFSVIFSFIGSKASEATYYGPLMLFSDAIEIHKLHNQVLVNNFKQIGSDRYDIGDNCIALVELFKSETSGGGRTRITMKCY
jgi:hypothetical protein